jgi:hypothetical protein
MTTGRYAKDSMALAGFSSRRKKTMVIMSVLVLVADDFAAGNLRDRVRRLGLFLFRKALQRA